MAGFSRKRRVVFKGLGAAGLVGILEGCLNDSGNSVPLGENAPRPPGPGPNPGLGSPPPLQPDDTNKLLIDATVEATGIPSGIPIYAYITGLVKTPGQVFYYYDSVAGRPVEMSTGDNTITKEDDLETGLTGPTYQQNYPDPWANYSIELHRDKVTQVADLLSFNSANIPGFGSGVAAFSGRIWISVGKPLLPFTPRVGGKANGAGTVDGYTTPVVSGGVGAFCLFDWLEFSFDVNGLLYINTTQVDQYGFPISISATGANVVGSPEGLYTKKRSQILTELAGLTAPFNTSLEMPTTGVKADTYPPKANTGDKLRALAPSKSPGIGTSTYLDTVIQNAMTHWKTEILTVTCSSNALQPTYYGSVAPDGKTLNFYLDKFRTGGLQFSFNDITTKNVLDCDGTLTGVNTGITGELLEDLKNTGKAILAGFNRGVISNTTTELNIDVGNGYTPALSENYPGSVASNEWARLFHECSVSGLAYGFAYDDVGDQQPMIIATKTSGLKLTLGKFE